MPTSRSALENRVTPTATTVCDRGMTIVMERPGANGLAAAVGALRDWQYEGSPMQLHPGDLGWNWSFGERTLAARQLSRAAADAREHVPLSEAIAATRAGLA